MKKFYEYKDTKERQHPLLEVTPMQPMQDMKKRATPIPMNTKMNLIEGKHVRVKVECHIMSKLEFFYASLRKSLT